MAAAAAMTMGVLAFAPGAQAAFEVRPDLRPGDVVTDRGMSVIAPPPGTFTQADAELAAGGAQSLGVMTAEDGTVSVGDGAETDENLGIDNAVDNLEPQTGIGDSATSPGACDDSQYNLAWFTFSDGSRRHYKWKTNYNWWFRDGSTPSGVGQVAARDALQRGIANMTGSHNPCGMADEVAATQSYAGDTTTGVDINASGNLCQSYGNKDGKNVIGFGTLPSNWLAYTCTWGVRDTGTYAKANESDAKYNKASYSWYADKPLVCNALWSIEAVATHEFGHTFGMGHVGEANHGNLTMSSAINGACQEGEKSLGRGDVLGMRDLY